MIRPPADVLAALGLEPDEVLSERGAARRPDPRVGQGWARTQAAPASIRELVDAAAAAPDYSPVEGLDSLRTALGIDGLELQRWDRDPGVLFLADEGLATRATGRAQRIEPGTLAVDCREGPAYVRLAGPGGEALLECNADVIRWFDLAPHASPELARLRDRTPAPVPEISAPALSAILGDAGVAPAVLAAARAMVDSRATLATAAAVGLVGRLARPPEGADPVAAALAVLTGGGPRARAAAWFRALDASLRREVVRVALGEVAALVDELEPLERDAAAHGADASERGRAWLHRRDDLASVALLALDDRDGEALRAALADLDREAVARHSLWSLLEGYDDDARLREVSWQEPHAWWGRLAAE